MKKTNQEKVEETLYQRCLQLRKKYFFNKYKKNFSWERNIYSINGIRIALDGSQWKPEYPLSGASSKYKNLQGNVEESLYQSCLQLGKKYSWNGRGMVWPKVQVILKKQQKKSGKGRGNAWSDTKICKER